MVRDDRVIRSMFYRRLNTDTTKTLRVYPLSDQLRYIQGAIGPEP